MPTELNAQHIVSLQVENVKRINAVFIEPKGNVVIISGNNGEGKTSVLDSIMYALDGKDSICDKPVKEGTDSGNIRIELNDLIVTKIIKPDRSCALKVTSKDGGKYAGPQGILDALVGSLSFDPMAFARMERAKQVAVMKQLVKLDFSAEDRKRQTLYEERTVCNQAGQRAAAQLAGMPAVESVPEEPISMSDMMREHAQALEINRTNDSLRSRAIATRDRAQECNLRLDNLRKQLEKVEEEARLLRVDAADASDRAKDLQDADAQAIVLKMQEVEGINRKVAHNKERKRIVEEHAGRQQQWKELSAEIDRIDKAKSVALQSAAFPIPGLSLSETAVTLNGIPFDQLSGAEQQRISLAMGFALNPKLKVLLLRDASLMDQKTLQMVSDMATAANAQVWLERVGVGEESAVVIEDGYVKGAPPPAPIATLDKVQAPKLAITAAGTIDDAAAKSAWVDAAAAAVDQHEPPKPRPTFGRPGRRST